MPNKEKHRSWDINFAFMDENTKKESMIGMGHAALTMLTIEQLYLTRMLTEYMILPPPEPDRKIYQNTKAKFTPYKYQGFRASRRKNRSLHQPRRVN
ncbi:hypothetical protein THRCLA_23272 [Thraustotheca clavata]|uniref:Uncharacterized protein n=1 Tax=Thraustotheca clavata TaxID=74557 RepID=A0A1V9Y893_9STRA|nr:hypothetical protein THRCLA_23272 [Thraustotheca clavata]